MSWNLKAKNKKKMFFIPNWLFSLHSNGNYEQLNWWFEKRRPQQKAAQQQQQHSSKCLERNDNNK